MAHLPCAGGRKTTLAQITREAPEKLREPRSLAESLLNRLKRQSHGSRGPHLHRAPTLAATQRASFADTLGGGQLA